ncbi:MAG: DNA replication and repair protein RecF [Proteobacteria bacterium]|nr:DNA replication and repair protein RecF [Pseudomonadota bacterium]NOG60696.1 DNA replication and repair protein RecF [Pseudomonadota bacterium]
MLCIDQLKAVSVRNLGEFSIEPAARLNFFYGPNASGKTSILECVYLLSRIKSFRSKRINDVVTRGEQKLSVFAKGLNQGKSFSVGIEKGRGITAIKYNGEVIQTASEQAKRLPVYVLTPDHHILFTGTPKDRRHWLDWSLFHVEQDYISVWKSYHRALRHRNTLLKTERSIDASELAGWEKLMAEEAIKIDSMRKRYISSLNQILNKQYLPQVLSSAGMVEYLNQAYENQDLVSLFSENRNNDVKKGYTGLGPHRTDISFSYDDFNVAKHLSRGQTKLFGAALISSQIEILKKSNIDAMILVDDLDAELDETSSKKMFDLLMSNNVQTFVSSLTKPSWFEAEKSNNAVFHVKHGKVEKMIE